MFDPVPALPADGRDVSVAIERWVRSPPLEALVTEFGGAPFPSCSLGDLLEGLEEFSRRWDYRRGKERSFHQHAPSNPSSELVTEAASALGLGGPTIPNGGVFDHILILGGLAPACFARCLYAAEILRAFESRPKTVTALGALRPLAEVEKTGVAHLLDEGPADEFTALDAGLHLAFSLDTAIEDHDLHITPPQRRWRVRKYLNVHGMPIQVIAAPTTRPGTSRANTADTMTWFAEKVEPLNSGERLLLVTTSLYVPYQHAEGLRNLTLPYGPEVEMCGVHPRQMPPHLAPTFTSRHYLQEIRSTICAFGRLLEDLDA